MSAHDCRPATSRAMFVLHPILFQPTVPVRCRLGASPTSRRRAVPTRGQPIGHAPPYPTPSRRRRTSAVGTVPFGCGVAAWLGSSVRPRWGSGGFGARKRRRRVWRWWPAGGADACVPAGLQTSGCLTDWSELEQGLAINASSPN
jgi:hypothetical protein